MYETVLDEYFNKTMDTLITIILVGLIAVILILSWKYERDKVEISPGESLKRIPIWLIISFLTILVLLYPRFKNMIQDLQRKYHM